MDTHIEPVIGRPPQVGERGTLLVLDFDDVLNACLNYSITALGPQLPLLTAPHHRQVRVRTAHGEKFLIDFDPHIIRSLDQIVHGYGMELAWLTTWGPNMRAVVEQAFDGLLAGGYVLAKQPPRVRGKRDRWWKARALHDAGVPAGDRPWIWADNEAIAETLAHRPELLDGDAPRLLLTPPTGGYGLTSVHLARIREFAARHRS